MELNPNSKEFNKTETEKNYTYIEAALWKKCSDILLDNNIIVCAIKEFFKSCCNINIGEYLSRNIVSKEPLAFSSVDSVVTDRYVFARKRNDNEYHIYYNVYVKYFVDKNNNILDNKNYIMTIYKVEIRFYNCFYNYNHIIPDLFDRYDPDIPAITENMKPMYNTYEFEINANMKFNLDLGFEFPEK